MPLTNFKSVYCVSSEDKAYPASNLLLNTNKKWKCEHTGESSIYVVLELEKASQITGIDIGNEHSAFIEVLVGKTGWPQEKYKEILLTSSFMQPLEGRNSTQTNRVRCFTKNALISPICDDKYNYVKLKCTQPFNKHVQYGISFIKVYCSDEPPPKAVENSSKLLSNTTMFGQFKLREDSPDSDETSSSLFSKWQEKKTSPINDSKTNSGNLSAAAAIREASNKATSSSSKYTPSAESKKANRTSLTASANKTRKLTDDEEPIRQDRNRHSLLYDEEDDTKSIPKLEMKIIKDRERIELERKQRAQLSAKKPAASAEKSFTKGSGSRDNGKKMEGSSSKFKDFLSSDLDMSSTSMNSSNIYDKDNVANEEKRSETKANSHSTKVVDHIGPAKKTPKDSKTPSMESNGTPSGSKANFINSPLTSRKRLTTPNRDNEPAKKKIKSPVKNKIYKPFNKLLQGVVIVISGIQNPERADIRDKAIRMGARYKPDWDHTCTHLICAFKNTPKYNQVKGKGKIIKRDWIIQCDTQRKRIPWRRHAIDSAEMDLPESEDEIYDSASKGDDDSTDDDVTIVNTSQQSTNSISSKYSDFDELENESARSKINIYDMETDEEPHDDANLNASQPNGNIFVNKTIYLSGSIGSVDEIKLRRIIVDNNGTISAKMAQADYIITKDTLAGGSSDSNAVAVKPLWIYECNEMNRLLPVNRYKI